MPTLTWSPAERLTLPEARDIPCYHAAVPGGHYRVAPVVYRGDFLGDCSIGYEAFFIPDGARSAADVRDIAEHLPSLDAAKAAAEADYRKGPP
jgi:hypothetical protein